MSVGHTTLQGAGGQLLVGSILGKADSHASLGRPAPGGYGCGPKSPNNPSFDLHGLQCLNAPDYCPPMRCSTLCKAVSTLFELCCIGVRFNAIGCAAKQSSPS